MVTNGGKHMTDERPPTTFHDRKLDVQFNPFIALQRHPDGTWTMENDWDSSCQGEWDTDKNEWVFTDLAEAMCLIANELPMLKTAIFPIDPAAVKATRKGLKATRRRARKRVKEAVAKCEALKADPAADVKAVEWAEQDLGWGRRDLRHAELALKLTQKRPND